MLGEVEKRQSRLTECEPDLLTYSAESSLHNYSLLKRRQSKGRTAYRGFDERDRKPRRYPIAERLDDRGSERDDKTALDTIDWLSDVEVRQLLGESML